MPCIIEVGGQVEPDCPLPAVGATLRFVERQEREPEPEQQPAMPSPAAPVLVPAPAAPVPAAAVPVPAVVAPAVETAETVGVADDIAAVTDAVTDMGLPASPVVMLALAAIVVLGGTKGWAFWRQRSEQSHAMAMKKLEMEAAAAKGSDTSSPKACRAVHQEMRAELASLLTTTTGQEARITAAERQLLPIDIDGVERQVRRLASRVADAEEAAGVLARRLKSIEDADADG